MKLYPERPIFIMAAPRSGSTLLFKTLAASGSLWTVGGEAHAIFEGIDQLRPGAPGVTSNRLTGAHVTPSVRARILNGFISELRDANGLKLLGKANAGAFRMLEKTPKNSLRIPFINEIFPDALFVYLFRDPRENISSIMDAWRSGGWVTYPELPGWEEPWSLLLPPGWQQLKGQSLQEIAAFQWNAANTMIMDDLAELGDSRWLAVAYADFLKAPGKLVKRICAATGIPFDKPLREHTARPLPLSRYTLTPPKADKWRKNAREIASILPGVLPVLTRMTEFAKGGLLSVTGQRRFMPAKTGRNDPCPCGSGKKYKRCHGNSVTG